MPIRAFCWRSLPWSPPEAYLFLRVIDLLPPYGTIGFGIDGLLLLVLAIARMFMI